MYSERNGGGGGGGGREGGGDGGGGKEEGVGNGKDKPTSSKYSPVVQYDTKQTRLSAPRRIQVSDVSLLLRRSLTAVDDRRGVATPGSLCVASHHGRVERTVLLGASRRSDEGGQ